MSPHAPVSYLLVDNDDRLADRMATALQARGYEVKVAYDGTAALSVAATLKPDRIVLDLSMPGIDGLEVLKRLREVSPASRTVLVTGYGSIPVTVDAVKLGAIDVLQKPVELAGILAAFDRVPGRASAEHRPPSLARAEWEHIQRVLRDTDNNISEAARRLGVHRRTLQRKLQKMPPKD